MKKAIDIVVCLVLILGFSPRLLGQEAYKLPPKEVIDILDAPPTPQASVNPQGRLLLLSEFDPMPSMAELSRPILRLAGMRIVPQTNGQQRTTYITGLIIQQLDDGKTRRIALPPGARLGPSQWSPDGKSIAFTRETDQGIELWVADAQTGAAKAITPPRVNATLGRGFDWMPDSRHILCWLVPSDRGPQPQAPRVPKGPNTQETTGKVAPVRTYQDLLETPHDEVLFDYYATAQLALIDTQTGRQRPITTPGVYASASASASGEFLLIRRVKRPYSYFVPYSDFARSTEVWNMQGQRVYTVADLPPAEDVPIQGVPTGPRAITWRPLQPATLIWVEALDGGDPKKKVPHRDHLMTLAAPFKSEPKEIYKVQHRYAGALWLNSGHHALISENDRDRRWRTTRLVNVDDLSAAAKVVFDLSVNDSYRNPGNPVMTATPRGENIVLQDGDSIYLSGQGATPEGNRPFLRRLNLQTLQAEEIFRSGPTSYEAFVDFVGDLRSRFVTRYESKTQPPNYFILDLPTGHRLALTDFKDPAPQLTGMRKELIKYAREDGVPLSGTLYLPPNYKEGERLPLVFWAYPREYNDPATAGQIRDSPNQFTFLRGISHLFFVTQGYAVFEAQMPVVGDPETMNNTFLEQIVMNGKAGIKKLDEMGVIDPERVGVGGHSYGAFMTANLLAHCDLFRAGIARSGAYNRTLTPFGFQNERRSFWEATDVYVKVSPFAYAHKVNEPILLIHGEMDNNSGTFPIQSERFFHALKGHGATARLVMLPYESHGYQARESILHVLAEMFEWFEKYVKRPETTMRTR